MEKTLKIIEYEKAKKEAQGIEDNRQVLIFKKKTNTYFVLSLYGLKISWALSKNPQDYIIYQLW